MIKEQQPRDMAEQQLLPDWIPSGQITSKLSDDEYDDEPILLVDSSWLTKTYGYYVQTKEIAIRFIGSNFAYSVLYVVLLVAWMIIPLLSLMGILLFRGLVVFLVVCIIRLGQKYVGDYVIVCLKDTWSKK